MDSFRGEGGGFRKGEEEEEKRGGGGGVGIVRKGGGDRWGKGFLDPVFVVVFISSLEGVGVQGWKCRGLFLW